MELRAAFCLRDELTRPGDRLAFCQDLTVVVCGAGEERQTFSTHRLLLASIRQGR